MSAREAKYTFDKKPIVFEKEKLVQLLSKRVLVCSIDKLFLNRSSLLLGMQLEL